jgi:hypothetical protein
LASLPEIYDSQLQQLSGKQEESLWFRKSIAPKPTFKPIPVSNKTTDAFPADAPVANPVFFRTYSRKIGDRRESWQQVCDRTVIASSNWATSMTTK